MSAIYEAILENGQLIWIGEAPASSKPVRVTVRIAPSRSAGSGERFAIVAERIASQGGIPSIPDPVEWQREQRQDPPLPGRDS